MHPTPKSAPTPPHAIDPGAAPGLSWRAALVPAASLIVFVLAAAALHQLLAEFSYASLRTALQALPIRNIGFAALATAASYLLLTGYDWSALQYIGKRIGYRTVAFAACCGYAISNTIGFSFLSGGSVRYRLYLDQGLDGADVARVTAFSVLAFGLGILTVGAVCILWHAEELAAIAQLDAALLRAAAGAICLGVAGFVAACFLRREPVRLGAWQFRLPGGVLILQQLLISTLDIACSGFVLYILLPVHDVPLAAFLAIYASATLAGVLSHVPGGIGVFEAVLLLAFRAHMPPDGLSAALVAYRAIYYLVPFVIASALLAVREVAPAMNRLALGARQVARIGSTLAPVSLSFLAFFSGAVLLWSAATPAVSQRLQALREIVPLFIVEVSHLLAATVGGALLVIAHGLRHKLNGAWLLALGLSVLGSAMTLVKGVDYEESVLLMLQAGLLWSTRRQFYRHTALLNARLSPVWTLGIVGTLAGMYVLIAFSYKHVEYAHELWWEFEFHGEASRALRAAIAGAMAIVLFSLWRLLRPPPVTASLPGTAEIDRAERIVRAQERSEGWLALMGDKRLLFADDDAGFLMYGVRGASWIAMGDPLGHPEVVSELAWRFRELVDAHGGRVAFYQAHGATLPMYLDMGLTPFKLGDEAVVALPQFSLDSSRRKSLRQTVARAERDGLSMRLCPPHEVPALLPALHAISDAWLAAKKTREKRFSLGAYTEAYVTRGDVAVVERGTRLVAFATVMAGKPGTEVSIDLMRHVDDAPASTMLYLFVQLFLHYRAAGYQRFTLGMAPLSGLGSHPLAPAWHRFGHLIYDRGERYYNFQGLRQFKDKFDPLWEPRYLVAQSGVNPLFVTIDVAALIAGSVTGVFAK